ncbi:MAG: 6-phosphofructokinase [Candidatus Omnitrophota bacterium]|nr:MAG: 6-phosphofructokinase [Candidatus Omnitrophota bacterium]
MKRIGVLTSGGDAPGMNAAIRSVVRCAIHYKLEVMGIFRGYAGLINEELKLLDHRSVSNIINRGGTILKTARSEEFMTEQGQRNAVEIIRKNEIDGLIVIGGDGTYRGGIALSKKWGIPCIGVPGTIDNDLNGTDATIGSDTAVNTALDAIDKIRDTATSMERIFVVEVMGRDSGFIALQVALAGGVEDALIPERNFDFNNLCQDIVEGNLRGKVSWIIVTAEGKARGEDIAKKISEMTTLETRVVVLGHIQRGGSPTAQDRILASRLGAEAVELLIKGYSAKALGVISDEVNIVDLEYAVAKKEFKQDRLYQLIKLLL